MACLGLTFLLVRAFLMGTSSSKIVFLKIDIDTVSHLIIETLPVHSVPGIPSYTLPVRYNRMSSAQGPIGILRSH